MIPRLLPFLTLLLTASSVSYADDQASLNVGMNIYGTTAGSSLAGINGYFLNFLSESGKSLIRPGFSAQLEYATGTPTGRAATTLIAGQLSAGLGFFVFKTNAVKPFIDTYATLGWANISSAGTSSIGLTYGGYLSGGAEIRLGKSANSKSIRIGSSYRIGRGNLGTIKELDALQLTFGIVF
jgi:hypothetical protein